MFPLKTWTLAELPAQLHFSPAICMFRYLEVAILERPVTRAGFATFQARLRRDPARPAMTVTAW
jgi:hypothetical protein